MKFFETTPDGHVIRRSFGRGSAVLQYCQNCQGLQPWSDDIGPIWRCPKTACPLHQYRTGRGLKNIPGNPTIEDRCKAIRFACLRCKAQPGDPEGRSPETAGGLGKYSDVLSCPSKSCPLWGYRRLDVVEYPVELGTGELEFVVGPAGFAKLVPYGTGRPERSETAEAQENV